MSIRSAAALSLALAALLASSSAAANGGGVSGYTGKPTAVSPQGESCNQCHSGGTAPQVSITGPASLAAGQSAEYDLVVTTGQATAGAGVAATDGVLLAPTAGSGLRESFGEVVQDGARTVTGGQASFRFRVTAPKAGTTFRLWAVGLASNGSGTGGDRATQATRDISVTGGTALPPDAGSSPSPGGADSGVTAPSDGGPSPANDAEESEDSDESSGPKRRRSTPEASSCAASFPPGGGGALGFASAALLALLCHARRRRERQ